MAPTVKDRSVGGMLGVGHLRLGPGWGEAARAVGSEGS